MNAENRQEEQKKVKLIKLVTDAFLDGETSIETYIEELDAVFYLDPLSRDVNKHITLGPGMRDEDKETQALRVAQLVKGWQDKDTDPHPLRSESGRLIPYSHEMCLHLFKLNSILDAVTTRCSNLSVVVKLVEEKN